MPPKKESRYFGRTKSDPVWIDHLEYLPITDETKVIELDAELAGGVKSFIGTRVREKNITAVTFNRMDFAEMLNYINENKMQCTPMFEILSECISNKTLYNILINDAMATHYGPADGRFGHEASWANMLKQCLPWLFIWNCITERAKGGYSSNIGTLNMYEVMRVMANNAGYTIKKYTTGKHNSTPKDGTKPQKMFHSTFYLVRTHDAELDFVEKNNTVITRMRYLRTKAPDAVWNLE